jgi:hypothetical protein
MELLSLRQLTHSFRRMYKNTFIKKILLRE